LNSAVIKHKGRFSDQDILRIWSNDSHKGKIRELISLMKNTKFDLCFEINKNEYLIPRLLPVDEIDYKWIDSDYNSKFEFRYKFMPKGILARLIVKMNSDVLNDQYWRYGVILKNEKTQALIKEKYFENKITIELNGPDKREFLYLIRKTINDIHKDFNKLNVLQMIPCNCDGCATSDLPHFYEYNLLRRYEENNINEIRCDISLLEVSVYKLTSDIAKKALSEEKIVVCENLNAELYNSIGLEKIKFFGERDSSSVYIQVKTKPDIFGLRDRDFLLDSEILKISKKYKNYFILEYYCIENYLFHPENINELNLDGFDKSRYTDEIVKQKNKNKNSIISIFKSSRNNYQEFKVESEKLRDKKGEAEIIKYIESDDLEIFFKSFSMKDHFKKETLAKYQLKTTELIKTEWIKNKFSKLIDCN